MQRHYQNARKKLDTNARSDKGKVCKKWLRLLMRKCLILIVNTKTWNIEGMAYLLLYGLAISIMSRFKILMIASHLNKVMGVHEVLLPLR